MAEASCRIAPSWVSWFNHRASNPTSTKAAVAICEACPLRADCLIYSPADPTLAGIWAGNGSGAAGDARGRLTYPLRVWTSKP